MIQVHERTIWKGPPTLDLRSDLTHTELNRRGTGLGCCRETMLRHRSEDGAMWPSKGRRSAIERVHPQPGPTTNPFDDGPIPRQDAADRATDDGSGPTL